MLKKLYTIQIFSDITDWKSIGVEFQKMKKSYATGAWAMIKAHYGGKEDLYRLIEEDLQTGKITVIENWKSSKIEF